MNDYAKLRADAERRLRCKENWGANPSTVLSLLDEVERLRAAFEEAKVLLLKPSFVCGRCPQIGRIVEAALNSNTGGDQ